MTTTTHEIRLVCDSLGAFNIDKVIYSISIDDVYSELAASAITFISNLIESEVIDIDDFSLLNQILNFLGITISS